MKWSARITALLILGYLIMCAGLYFAQDALIFPSYMVTYEQTGSHLSLQTDEGETQVLIRDKQSACDVIYFGGNAEAVDASLEDLARAFSQCTILSLIYRGYGPSDGTPSQDHIYADAEALYRLRQGQSREFIIVGRSLGSSVATYLAAKISVNKSAQLKQLILITPFDSMAELVSGKFPWLPTGLLLKHSFPSADYAAEVSAPVHIIQAEMDEVIPAIRTHALQTAFRRTKPQLTQLAKVGHNTVDTHPAFIQVLGRRL